MEEAGCKVYSGAPMVSQTTGQVKMKVNYDDDDDDDEDERRMENTKPTASVRLTVCVGV